MYKVYLDGVLLPVTPKNLEMKINNKNTTVTLINDGEVNILKKAGLTDISFTALLPQVKYPFSLYENEFLNASYYIKKLEELKTSNTPFQFIVTRSLPDSTPLFDTNMTVSIEDYTLTEDADNAFDITVKINLKQYREYSTKLIAVTQQGTDNSSNTANSLEANNSSFKVGDMVKVKSTATTYYRGQKIPDWVNKGIYEVYYIKGDYVAVDKTGINSPFRDVDLYLSNEQTVTTQNQRSTKGRKKKKKYKVKDGDTMWKIARTYLSGSNKYGRLYEMNKDVIEKAARKNGKISSCKGAWIYAGVNLALPD